MDPMLRRKIRAASLFTTLGFLVLSSALGYWQIRESHALLQRTYNRHWTLLERQIRRGSILDRSGVVLATSPSPGRRVYPHASLFANITGYISARFGRAGLEGKLDNYLSGMGPAPNPLKPNPLLVGERKKGDNVYLTLDLQVQKAAAEALGDRRGAVVALDPSTGRILALVSHPSYDPTDIDAHWATISTDKRQPLFDRALQGLYQPGSTFKVMTASAAIDTGVDTPNDEFDCPGYIRIGNHTIHEMDGEVHGHLNLSSALAQSCNITFAQVGLRLGAERLLDYANRFHIDQPLDIMLPTATGQIISGERTETAGAKSGTAGEDPRLKLLRVPTILAQTAFGQGQVAISPLQDALISAAVANHGVMMKPFLVDRIEDPVTGQTLAKGEPTILARPISSATAATVASMMQLTFTEGTARHLQVPGLVMAGKTGTAQTPSGRTHAWFVGFAPADHPRVVAACIVENGGVGGIAAGPVVRAAILAALRHH